MTTTATATATKATATKESSGNARKKLQAMFAQDVVDACVKQNFCPWLHPLFGRTVISARSAEGYKYNGVNNIFLTLRMLEYGWTHPVFGTSRTWKRVGVTPNESYKTSPIFYYKRLQKTDENGNPVVDEKGNPIEYPILKYSRVINIEQTDADLNKFCASDEYKTLDETEALNATVNVFDACSQNTGLQLVFNDALEHGEYNRDDKAIAMPDPDKYPSMHAFCEDMLRQMATASSDDGDPSTDKRKQLVVSLTAEMATSIMMYHLGIAFTKQKDVESWTAYCKEWAERIKEYPDALWKAAGNATKVVESVLGKAVA